MTRRRLMDDPRRRAQLALHLAAIGCTCAQPKVVYRDAAGVAFCDVHHDERCPVLRKIKAREQ